MINQIEKNIKMEKTFEGLLFNRMEKLGGRTFNHVGCKGESEEFIDFLAQFVPDIGTQRRVKFTVETEDDIEKIDDYKIAKDYNEDKEDD